MLQVTSNKITAVLKDSEELLSLNNNLYVKGAIWITTTDKKAVSYLQVSAVNGILPLFLTISDLCQAPGNNSHVLFQVNKLYISIS